MPKDISTSPQLFGLGNMGALVSGSNPNGIILSSGMGKRKQTLDG